MASYLDKDGLKAVWSRVVTQTYDQANAQIHESILNFIYPIGSIYASTKSTSPASFIGGTWHRIQGAFLVGVDDTDEKYAANKIGFVAHATGNDDIVPFLNVYIRERTA